MIFVDVDDTKKLVVNSLNGTLDEVDMSTYETLVKWQKCESITTETAPESELLSTLQARGYLVTSDEEEAERKNKILNVLRKNNETDRKQCHHITFVMTYNCNFRCPYCFEGEAYLKKEVMTTELIDAALNLADDSLQTICLFGGEPLLPQTRPAIEHLFSKKPGILYSVITNGYYLEEYVELLSSVKIADIMVTLDGKEQTHNKNRYLANGMPTYQKILQGISKALEAGIVIKVRVNVSEDSLQEGIELQQSLLEMFEKHKDLLKFEIAPLLGYSHETKSKLTTDMFCSVVEHDNDERLKRNNSFSTLNPMVSALAVGMPVRPLYSFCYAHRNNLAVDPYGNLFTCLVTVGKDGMEAGKYYPAVEYKEHSIFNRNIDKIPECRDCTYSLLCGGGCPMGLCDYSNLFRPACSSVKNSIHDLLPRIYEAGKNKT